MQPHQDVARRRFQPGAPDVWLSSLLWALVILVGLGLTIRTSTVAYSPDSWTYVDLARSLISSDRSIGDIQGTRDYVNTPWVNDSFPFLWPILLAPGVAVLGPAAPVGGYLFVIVWLLTCLALSGTTRTLHLPTPVAPLFGLALFALPGYVGEGHAGRSIPLNVLLLVCSIWILLVLQSRRSVTLTVALGVLLGLTAANRFDSLAYGPIFIALATALGLLSVRQGALSLATWIALPAVWVFYSLSRLGGLYVTDNSRVLLSPEPVFVRDWPKLDSGGSGASLATLEKMLANTTPVIYELVDSYRYWVVLAVGALVLGSLLARASSGAVAAWLARWIAGTDPSTQWPFVRFLIALTLSLGVWQFFLLSGTGYTDARYWAATGLVFLELMIFGTVSAAREYAPRRTRFTNAVLITSTSVLAVVLAGLGVAVAIDKYAPVSDQTTQDPSVVACISDLNGVPILEWETGYRIPATTGLLAALVPSNADELAREDWVDLIASYGVTHWVDTAGLGDFPLPRAAVGLLTEASCLPGG